MKRSLLIGTLCPLLLIVGALDVRAQPEDHVTDEGPPNHILFAPADISWQAGPASFEKGAEFSILEGNPGEAGVFTMRIRMPDGFLIAPHWHPKPERVTVISGTFLLGSGDELNREATERMEPGSYTSMPPGMRHYAVAEGETVIQLTSTGPWKINYVDPSDDPRATSP